MKNIFKYLAVVAMSVALMGMVACKEKPENPEPTPDPSTESSSYAFQYDGAILAAGDTVDYYPSMQQTNLDFANVDFFPVNKTNANLGSVIKVERAEGPVSFDDLEICYDGNCRTGTCPYTTGVLDLVPGVNTDMKITIDYTPSAVTARTIYRITLGKGTSLEDPQVFVLNLHGAE